jgi:voltage-dependent potassium channel beta subunit
MEVHVDMEYRNLGATGLKVSALSFGSWVTFANQVDEAAAATMIRAAFDAGVNFFDNAEAYAQGRSEEVMGAALRRLGLPRSSLVISTKIFWGGDGPNDRGLSRKHVLEGTDASLHRLGLDFVDVLFCHRADLHTPVEETVGAMDHLIQQGKVLYWGTSEWPAERILEAYHVARRERLVPPVVEQPQYNLFHRDRFEREYEPLYDRIGLGTTIWSPLASGLLTGKYNDGIPRGSRPTLEGYEWLRSRFEGNEVHDQIEQVQALEKVAQRLDASVAQLAIAWCLKNPRVSTVILGASRLSQLEENLGALAVAGRLDDEIMASIEEIVGNRPEPEHDWR